MSMSHTVRQIFFFLKSHKIESVANRKREVDTSGKLFFELASF